MHNSKIIFLINDNARAIRAIYDPALSSTDEVFKTMDHNLVVGDIVVVKSAAKHGFSICKVTEIDVEPDLESEKPIKWAFSKVNSSGIKETLAKEAKAIAVVNAAERERKKKAMRETLFAGADEKINALELADHSEKGDVFDNSAS